MLRTRVTRWIRSAGRDGRVRRPGAGGELSLPAAAVRGNDAAHANPRSPRRAARGGWATDGVDTRHRHAAPRRAANLGRGAERASELASAERGCDRASVPDLL